MGLSVGVTPICKFLHGLLQKQIEGARKMVNEHRFGGEILMGSILSAETFAMWFEGVGPAQLIGHDIPGSLGHGCCFSVFTPDPHPRKPCDTGRTSTLT